MTNLKPQIFIGSSGTGLPSANIVKKELSAFGDVYIWTESDLWEPNDSTFDNLLRMSAYFDFGVFVATPDDLTLTSKEELNFESRDNVILEMALFVGALGKKKSFLIVEETVDKPSDFHGIYMPTFKLNDTSTIIARCAEIGPKITESYYDVGHLSLYPTTALAIGYYKNFIEDLVASMQMANGLEIEGTKYDDFSLKVVMPKDLKGRVKEKASLFYKKHGFTENSLQTPIRKHPLWFKLDPQAAPKALMYDMPSTLTGIDIAIEMKLEKGYAGRTKLQEIIEQRELNNFRKVLQIMLNTSAFAAASVEIIDEF